MNATKTLNDIQSVKNKTGIANNFVFVFHTEFGGGSSLFKTLHIQNAIPALEQINMSIDKIVVSNCTVLAHILYKVSLSWGRLARSIILSWPCTQLVDKG